MKGYPGTTGIALAMERGEVKGMVGDDWASIKANKADWLREQEDPHPDAADGGAASRSAGRAGGRRIRQGRGQAPACWRCSSTGRRYGRPFLAPPGTPAPIVAAYRAAFGKVVRDPDFVREAEQAKLIIKVASGAEMTALVDRIYDNPKPVIEQATALVRSVSQ